MKYNIIGELPFIDVYLTFKNNMVKIENVLIDTGSYGTVFDADILVEVGIKPEQNDTLKKIRGVGGEEYVYSKRIDQLKIGNIALNDFNIEVGAMDYGFNISGILGYNFIRKAELIIDSKTQEIYKSK